VADLRAYQQLVLAQLRAQGQYRVSFAIDLASAGIMTFLEAAVVVILFRVTRSLGGFAIREAFLMAGLAGLAFNVCDMCVGNIERIRLYVRTGRLDAVLIRPRSVLLQLILTDFTPRRIGQVVQATVVFVVASALAPVDWTPAHAVLLVLSPFIGAIFFMGLFVAGSTVAFYWIESGEFANAFTYGGRTFSMYPISIYSGLFRNVFAFGLGFAFVAYYPALTILGKPDPLGGPAWLGWCTPVAAAASVALAGLLWRTGIRHYRGTGS
jgi:viologen exporter family transport system permease protein